MIIGGLTIVWCVNTQQKWTTRTVTEQVPVKQSLLINPDQLKVNGDLVTGPAQDIKTGQQEIFTFFVRSPVTADQISKLTSPTIWLVEGQMQPILPRTNENQFDPWQYYHHRHICNQVRITKINQIIAQPVSFKTGCHVLRKKLSLYFEQLPQPLGAYCQQLIIGSSDDSTADLMVSVKKLGLVHLFCISGMHVVLLVRIIRRLLVYLWWEREHIEFMLAIVLPCYLIIGGGAPSLVRATVMAELGLLHRYLHLSSLDGWSISLLLGLLLDPLLLMTLGGQLTYLLSGVLQLLPPTIKGFKQSLLLNLVSLPSILSYVYEVHLLSFFVSYLLIPIFAVLIFPAVIMGALVFRLWPVLTYVINAGIRFFQLLLDWLASFPGMICVGKPPLLLAISIFTLTLIAIGQGNLQGWRRLILVYVFTILWIHFPLSGEVVFADIGQGDSIIIRTPFNRQVIMIDTGGKLAFKKQRLQHTHDDAQRITVNYLKSKGIRRIDAVFLTHHDADHIGYLPTILDELQVKQIIVPAGMERQPTFINKIANVSGKGLELIPVTDTVKLNNLPVQILHPFRSGEAKNEDSLVLAGTFGGQRIVLTGDLDQQNEQKVIQKYPQLRADILKVGHHGSKTASSPAFLRQLAPQYAIISAGRFNRYHHPDQETVEHLRQAKIIPLSTQQFGMIKYVYYGHHGKLITVLKGDETRWTLPSYLLNYNQKHQQ